MFVLSMSNVDRVVGESTCRMGRIDWQTNRKAASWTCVMSTHMRWEVRCACRQTLEWWGGMEAPRC